MLKVATETCIDGPCPLSYHLDNRQGFNTYSETPHVE